MKAVRRMITDLPFDLLKCIMILMVKSSGGAANLARAISVCPVFLIVAEDTDVLKAVCFQNLIVWSRHRLFQHINGLLYICAQAGNEAAQYLLAKVILVTSSQLLGKRMPNSSRGCSTSHKARRGKVPWDDALAANFMAHFAPGQSLLHAELVRKFLCQCSVRDFTEMHPYFNSYIDYFTECGSMGNFFSHYLLNKMFDYGDFIIASEEAPTVDNLRLIRERSIEKRVLLRQRKRLRQSNQVPTMEAVRRMITDLHFDLLKCIMILMVKSSGGAANLARAISACPVFLNVAEDTDVLKTVCFRNLIVWSRDRLFQHTNGLLYRCAQAGNEATQCLLAKVNTGDLFSVVGQGNKKRAYTNFLERWYHKPQSTSRQNSKERCFRS